MSTSKEERRIEFAFRGEFATITPTRIKGTYKKETVRILLTHDEWQVAVLLFRKPGTWVKNECFLSIFRERNVSESTRLAYVSSAIASLRGKLASATDTAVNIRNAWRQGYRVIVRT